MMSIKFIFTGMLCSLCVFQARAGDAVAMAYNSDGVWTALTYIRSTTPKSGAHYHDSTEAGASARQDLHRRAGTDLFRTKVIGQSDRTCYVTIARGKSPKPNTCVTVIGRGKTQPEADQDALQQLSHAAAAADEKIVYQYFSYGSDANDSPHPNPKRRGSHT
jgi:hypothetical protein